MAVTVSNDRQPCTSSLALSQMHLGGTPSHTNSNDKVSCASLLDAIGKALAHQKSVAYTCAHLLPLLNTVLANIVSENTGCAR